MIGMDDSHRGKQFARKKVLKKLKINKLLLILSE
jgi:hypothetical protein